MTAAAAGRFQINRSTSNMKIMKNLEKLSEEYTCVDR